MKRKESFFWEDSIVMGTSWAFKQLDDDILIHYIITKLQGSFVLCRICIVDDLPGCRLWKQLDDCGTLGKAKKSATKDFSRLRKGKRLITD